VGTTRSATRFKIAVVPTARQRKFAGHIAVLKLVAHAVIPATGLRKVHQAKVRKYASLRRSGTAARIPTTRIYVSLSNAGTAKVSVAGAPSVIDVAFVAATIQPAKIARERSTAKVRKTTAESATIIQTTIAKFRKSQPRHLRLRWLIALESSEGRPTKTSVAHATATH
jgi:hypothetical protein